MKKGIIALTLFLAVGISSAFANEDVTVTKKVLNAFQSDFTKASNVKWSQVEDFYKVNFNVTDMTIEAYYDADGKLMGSARYLSFEQLPLAVIHEFNRRFPDSFVKNIVEISNDEGTSYRIWAEFCNKSLKLRANASGDIITLERKKK